MGNRNKTKGDQVVNKLDLNQVSQEFIKCYYGNWMTNLEGLLTNPMWQKFTKMNVDGKSLNHQEIALFHQQLTKGNLNIIRYQFVPDGGRRVNLMVQGTIAHQSVKSFVQNFVIMENKGVWWIQSNQIFFY